MKKFLLLILFLSAPEAQAQGPMLNCTASVAVTPMLRADSLADLVGDYLITCTGGIITVPGGAVPQYNLTVFINTNLTSQQLMAAGAPGDWSEALLIVDEAPPANQRYYTTAAGCTMLGTGIAGGANYLNTDAHPYNTNPANVFQGRSSAANQVEFIGIPFDPPGAGHTRTMRITNIRANANMLGYSLTVPNNVLMMVNAGGLMINNAMQTVGFSLGGLVTSCDGSTKSSGVSFRENFASSFKTGGTIASNTVGVSSGTENGFYTPLASIVSAGNNSGGLTTNIGNAGLAFAGTRLMVTFNEVSNAPVYVPSFVPLINVANGNISGYAVLVGGTLTVPSPAPTTAAQSQLTQVTIAASTGNAVYEIMQTDLTKMEDLSIPFFDSLGNSLTFTGTAAINLATSGGSGSPSLTAAVPRFNAAPTKTWTMGP